MVTARELAELNLWQRIFAEHWDAFAATWRTENGRSVPSHWAANVKRMVGCGDIAVGYREYECEDCGTTKKVGFTCKSKLCLRCFKVAVDDWLQTARKVLFEDVVHRQVVLTVPIALRALVLADARFMKAFADAGARAVKELIAEWRPKQRIKVGIMSVLQLHGRGGNSNPPHRLRATLPTAGSYRRATAAVAPPHGRSESGLGKTPESSPTPDFPPRERQGKTWGATPEKGRGGGLDGDTACAP